jgi:aryl carrier-like protein
MVPAALVALERLPLTDHGKVDRASLPEPTTTSSEFKGDYVAPGTALERTIAAVWGEVLHLDRVGIRDNFFDRGGNSLSLVEVRNRLRTRIGGEVSVMMLFQYPTIEAFARHVGARSVPAPVDDMIIRRAHLQRQATRTRATGAARPFHP